MILTQKNTIPLLKLKSFLFLVVFFCFSVKFSGQEFEWVYTAKTPIEDNTDWSYCDFNYLTINTDDEVYAVGLYGGIINFGDEGEEILLDVGSSFIVKLDKYKNILWLKTFRYGIYHFTSIVLDDNEDLVISGVADPSDTQLYFDDALTHPTLSHLLLPTHEDLSNEKKYGFVLKIDKNGNYQDCILFKDIQIRQITKDHNNNTIAVGDTIEYAEIYNWNTYHQWGYIVKLDNDLNIVWEKTYQSQVYDNRNAFLSVQCDSQNNIYCEGIYQNVFNFGSTSLSKPYSGFLCKLSSDGSENWIIEASSYAQNPIVSNTSPDNHSSYLSKYFSGLGLLIDAFDNIYYNSRYPEEHSFSFNNTTIDNLPVHQGSLAIQPVLFKMDTHGNHIWNVPLYGEGNYLVTSFNLNNYEELLVAVRSINNYPFYYKNQNTIITPNNVSALLLKINTNGGGLIDFKRMDHGINSINTDSDNNILLGGSYQGLTDFDPHPFNEYLVTTNTYINPHTEEPLHTQGGFVLKLKNCEVEPLFLDSYDFCSGNHPNPTIADIKPSALNLKWYSSMTSQAPLSEYFALSDGQTIYYENTVDNCPNIGRFPLVIHIIPAPAPPIISASQPCYFENMRLSDVSIQGENLLFYASLTATEPILNTTVVIPETVYYVSQTINDCESDRIPIVFYDLFGSIPNQQSALFCRHNNTDYGFANLSEYNSLFISDDTMIANYDFSYHTSYDDAFEDQNHITAYQNYQATDQTTIFVRTFSLEHSCFKVVELLLQFSVPSVISEIKIEDWTDTNNSITVLPYDENYLYSLDGITYQTNNHFQDLPIGEYNLYVKDKGDCSETSEKVYLLSYPKYFTPNGDGFNDMWRIKFSQFEFLVDVEIYDRYGKIITFFDKDSTGWDGTLNGNILPATDYWFRIIRISDRKIIYRGHFSLVR